MPDDEPTEPYRVEQVADLGSFELTKGAGARYTELGSSGLVQTGGFVAEEFLRALQGDKGRKVYREMSENDPVVSGLLFSIEMLVGQVEWRVEPPEAASVEEIVRQRQEERARAIAAAKNAKAQQEAMAEQQAAMGAAGGGAANPMGKPNAPAGQQVAKAMIAMGIDPSRHALSLARLDRVSRDAKDLFAKRMGREAIYKAADGNTATTPVKSPAPPTGTAPIATPTEVKPEDVLAEAVVEGEDIAVFIETALHDMEQPFTETISEVLSMLIFGYSWHELVYKKRVGRTGKAHTDSRFTDGRIGWRKWALRAQETTWRWEFDPASGDVTGMWQLDPYNGKGMVFLPIEKALHFRTKAVKGNPEGRSVLRGAYRPWYYKRRIEEIEAIGVERDLAGLPVMKVPYRMMTPQATPAEQSVLTEIKQIVRNIRRDEQEGVIIPQQFDPDTNQPMFELSLLSTGGQRQFDTDKIVSRYDQRIAMVVLADFILLGHEKVGSFSLGQVKADLFTSALESWLGSIADVVNLNAVPRLLKLNAMDPAASPTLTHGRLQQVDLVALGDFVTKLAQAGAPLFPDDTLENWLRDAAGMPARDASDELAE